MKISKKFVAAVALVGILLAGGVLPAAGTTMLTTTTADTLEARIAAYRVRLVNDAVAILASNSKTNANALKLLASAKKNVNFGKVETANVDLGDVKRAITRIGKNGDGSASTWIGVGARSGYADAWCAWTASFMSRGILNYGTWAGDPIYYAHRGGGTVIDPATTQLLPGDIVGYYRSATKTGRVVRTRDAAVSIVETGSQAANQNLFRHVGIVIATGSKSVGTNLKNAVIFEGNFGGNVRLKGSPWGYGDGSYVTNIIVVRPHYI